MILRGWNQLLGLPFSTGNPLINISISTWCWLLNEETVKLPYSSVEWDPRYPLKVARHPQFLLGGQRCLHMTYIWVGVLTCGNIKYYSYSQQHRDITAEESVLQILFRLCLSLCDSLLLVSLSSSFYISASLWGCQWYQIRLKGYSV